MRKVLTVLLCLVLIAGCGRAVRIIRGPLPEEALKESALIAALGKKRAESKFKGPLRVGEKFTYSIQWLGLNVGTATLEVKEVVEVEGRQAYHIVSTARSNRLISKIYKVRDHVHSFVDVERFVPLRFEKYQSEGFYRSKEIITYNHDAHTAVQKSLISGESKDIKILPNTQDVLSCLYYFRIQDVKAGKSVFIPVNARDKNYTLEVKALKLEMLRVARIGTFRVIKVEPLAKFRGIFVKKGKILIWITDDKEKIPLLVRTKVPIAGSVDIVLTKIE